MFCINAPKVRRKQPTGYGIRGGVFKPSKTPTALSTQSQTHERRTYMHVFCILFSWVWVARCALHVPFAVCKKNGYKRNETAAAAMENKEVEKHFPFFSRLGDKT